MSQNHIEHGHFSGDIQRKIRKTYTHICALCNRPGRACDHLFPLNAIDFAEHFGVDIHSFENGWLLCNKCHNIKSKEENAAYPHGELISKIYNRYWKLAFTPKGCRRIKEISRNKIDRKGTRKRGAYIVQGNRLKVALKKAKANENATEIEQLEKAIIAWQYRNPGLSPKIVKIGALYGISLAEIRKRGLA